MDLSPDQVQAWLDGLREVDLRRVGMSAEEFCVLRSRVAEARQVALEAEDARAYLSRKLAAARADMVERRRVADRLMLRHRQAYRDLLEARAVVSKIERKIEEVSRGK
jgi:hypothetical protein